MNRMTAFAALLLAALAASPLSAGTTPAKVSTVQTFKDWMAGCDNIRNCTALGLSPGAEFSGHAIVKREGGAMALAYVSFVVRSDNRIALPAELSILVDGAPVAGMTRSSWPAPLDDGDSFVVRVQLGDADAATLLRQMHDGKTLDLKVTGADQASFGSTVSLAGAAASFLYMDDAQLRTGTVTALVKPGTAAASTIPPVPPIPILKAVVMRTTKNPPAKLPQGVTPWDPDDCGGISPRVSMTRLSPSLKLWGVCYVRARYREEWTFWLAGRGAPKRASFAIPGRPDNSDDAGILPGPEFSKDGRLLESYDSSRGLGDCGSASKWVWTGTAFALAYLSEMPDCKGVRSDDWPVLYQARWK